MDKTGFITTAKTRGVRDSLWQWRLLISNSIYIYIYMRLLFKNTLPCVWEALGWN